MENKQDYLIVYVNDMSMANVIVRESWNRIAMLVADPNAKTSVQLQDELKDHLFNHGQLIKAVMSWQTGEGSTLFLPVKVGSDKA